MMRELFDMRERPLFGQPDPLALEPLPADDVITDLGARFAAEDLDPGEALAILATFAAGHPQRTMLLAYLLADALTADAEATPETAADVITSATERTAPAHQAVWQQLATSERGVLAAVADGIAPSSRSFAGR